MESETLRFTVTDEQEGERLDRFLASCIDGFSRSYLQKLIDRGDVLVNDVPAKKAGVSLRYRDELTVTLPESDVPDIKAENIPLDILYEDDDVIVVNKPQGMVVHPAAGHYEGTLVNALLYHCRDSLSGINGVLRPGIVHRIDKDTSGSILVCKNDNAHRILAEAFREHSIRRRYLVLVHGQLPQEEGTVSTLIGRDPKNRLRMAVLPSGGKEAVTHYRVIKRFRDYTFAECVLETGRTHQIRVHMAYLNHPVLGDPLYCSLRDPYHLNGQCLHAAILGFNHPVTGGYIETEAPLPVYFQHLLEVMPS